METVVIEIVKISTVIRSERAREAKSAAGFREWWRGVSKPSHLYVWPEGETILEGLYTRRQRPYTVWKKSLIPDVLERLGLPRDAKVNWSQRCGCSCGCSPGFKVHGDSGADYHITIKYVRSTEGGSDATEAKELVAVQA